MLGLIPYFEIPSVSLGPLVLDPWATLVAIGFIVGLEVSRARGIRLGLDVRDIVDGVVVTVGMGFLLGHVSFVLFYHPDLIQEQGWLVLARLWDGFASTGGFMGAIVGAVLFYKVLRKRPFWIHADTIAFGFPFGWFFGRLGCFTAHDHPGRLSHFLLAVDFPRAWGGPRHDLGLDEALWTLVIAATFFALRKRRVKPGFFVALLAVMYAPARIGLDFLRALPSDPVLGDSADLRFHGLTPAQWWNLLVALVGLVMAWRLRGVPHTEAPVPPDGSAADHA